MEAVQLKQESVRELSRGSYAGWEIKYMTAENFFIALKEIIENQPMQECVLQDYKYMLTLVKGKKADLWRDLRREQNRSYNRNTYYILGERKQKTTLKLLTEFVKESKL